MHKNSLKGGYVAKTNQKGFSPIYIVLGVIAIIIVMGAFFYVRNRNELQSNTNEAVARTADETIANGTPKNAVKAVTEQVSTEIMAEDSAMKLEEEATKLDDAELNNLEGVANETNL